MKLLFEWEYINWCKKVNICVLATEGYALIFQFLGAVQITVPKKIYVKTYLNTAHENEQWILKAEQ